MKKAVAKTFAARLRSLREAAALSAAALADKANIDPGFLHHLEAGTKQPSWETVCKLADALKVGTDTFRNPA